MRDLDLGRHGIVPARFLSVSFARSGGPGGQNVNKVSTKADLRLDLAAASALLDPAALARARARLGGRLDADGRLQIVSSEHRTQARNLEAATARLEALLRRALEPARPRRKTRPTAASRERRLAAKKQRSRLKRTRREEAGE